MVYIATMEIGGYKKGAVVPDEKALVWEKMYDVSPVEKRSKAPKPKVESKAEPKEKAPADAEEKAPAGSEEEAPADPGKEEAPPEEESKEEKAKGSSLMIDDYLGRNANVVVHNIKSDDLDGETLEKLLEHEKAEKNRDNVVEAIESDMKKEIKGD